MRLFHSVLIALVAMPVTASDPLHIFKEGAERRPIGSVLSIYTDTLGTLSADQALHHNGFVRSRSNVPNLGISKATTWFRFSLRNTTTEDKLLLILHYPDIDKLDVFVEKDGKAEHVGTRGQAVVPKGRVRSGSYMFEIEARHKYDLIILLRVEGHKQLHVPLLITSPIEAVRLSNKWELFAGGLIGIMLVMALYNLFVFIAIRDTSYLVYVLYIVINAGAQLTVMGTAQSYFWPNDQWLAVHASVLFVLMSIATGILFTQRFINTGRYSPRLHRIHPVFHGAILLTGTIYLWVDTTAGYKMAQGISGFASIYLLTMAISSWRSGSRSAGFFLLAWSFFLMGVLAFVLKDAGVLPYNSFTANAMPIGAMVEAVLLSFGLADRINVLRRESARSQAAALEASLENERIIREQNVLLESKVKERTSALQESNEHLKRTQTQLVNAEKMASLGQLTAGIAHEINNPINFITGNIDPLRRNIGEIMEVMKAYRTIEPSEAASQLPAVRIRERELGIDESLAELDDIIASIAEGSHRTAEIVRGLRNFSRLDENDLKAADLNDGIRSTLAVLAPQFREKVQFVLKTGDLPAVECFPGKVNQVFMNILTNAAQATLARHDLGDRRVSISTQELEGGVEICIADNGTGMSEEVKMRLYDPFFTTKPVGEGTGLGMAIVYGIVQDHHGTISVESMPGVGTEFRLFLPLLQPRAEQRRA